jgi:outer membrane protein insertion porin family
MNKRLLASWLSLSFIATASYLPLMASESSSIVATYDRMPVENIEVIMEQLPTHSSFDNKIILNKLKTHPGDPFSQTTFDDDLKTLSEEYDRVEPSIEVHNGRLFITLRIWLRPTIRSIQWEGNDHIKTKTLQKELDIKPDSVFDRQGFNSAFNKLKDYYMKKGYFESILQYKVVLDPKTNEVDILIDISEGRSGKIENIVFNGFSKQEQSQLLEMIYTKKYNLLLSWVTGSGLYNEPALEQDEITIINYLQNKGYADAKVQILIKEGEKEGKIIIEINADKGSLYHFGKIAFNGNQIFSDQDVESQFVARPGGIYSPEKLRMTAQNIKDLCGRKGYIETQVQYETTLVPGEDTYNVEFSISEGEQYKIGLIHVIGNSRTQTHVILRESLLVPGEMFDSAKLKITQQKLESIGYFKSVNVYAVRTQDDILLGENYRDVYIEVDETTTGNVSLFFGFSSADDVFGGLDLVETNFNIAGVKNIFKDGISALRGDGEFLRAKANFGSKQHSYTLSWLDPYFRDSLWRLGIDTTYSRSDLQSKEYDINTLGTSVYASYPLNSLWTFGVKYRIKNAHTHVSSDASQEEQQKAGRDGLLSAVSTSMTFDSTDSAIRPRRGFRSFLEGEFAGVGGEIGFLRLMYTNAYYTPIWRYGTMKYRFDFKFIAPVLQSRSANDIFMSERFFLGGENTVRGYKAFHLGPVYPGKDQSPQGGISSTLFSLEYRQYIMRMLDIFVFTDAGALSMDRFHIPTIRLTYGIGARVDLLNRIPIELGWGFPANPKKDNKLDSFFISMGGQF